MGLFLISKSVYFFFLFFFCLHLLEIIELQRFNFAYSNSNMELNKWGTLLIVFFIWGCTSNPNSESYQTEISVDSVVAPSDQNECNMDSEIDVEAPRDIKPYTFVQKKTKRTKNYFSNPLEGDILISGSFCELRGNHFHAGMDMRTGGEEGWDVKAAADGYIERIKVSTSGYGNVIYVKHPNGYSTVYGHLKQFIGAASIYVREKQYSKKTFEIELYPKAGELPVKKGQIIALSGNTGGSGGPHLHFEIRNPQGNSTNPLLHGLPIRDQVNPEIKRISIYHKDKESLYTSGNYPYITLSKWGEEIQKQKILKLKSGVYRFGIMANDYFTDKNNVLGINYCWITANKQLVFSYQIDEFNFSQGRYINTHIDPYLKYKDNQMYVRLFKEKFNPLPFYEQKNNGDVIVNNGDTLSMSIYIKDFAGQMDSVSWTIVGDELGKVIPIPGQASSEQTQRIKSNSSIQFHEWKIDIPSKSYYHPFDLKLKIKPSDSQMLSKTLQMHYPYTLLQDYIHIAYTVPKDWLVYGDQLCAFSKSGSTLYYEGGALKKGMLTFKTRSFGEYVIGYDNEPPTIRPITLGKNFKFIVKDLLSGIQSFNCYIDDKWILASYEPKTNTIWGEIPNWISQGEHEFKIRVSDNRKNSNEYMHKVMLD